MTVYTDAVGNVLMGDCIYANHDIAFPNNKYLLTDTGFNDFPADLSTLVTNAGLRVRHTATLAQLERTLTYTNTFSDGVVFVSFGGNSDTINNRYSLFFSTQQGTSAALGVGLYNNSGYVGTNFHNGTNAYWFVGDGDGPTVGCSIPFTNRDRVRFAAVADSESLALFTYQHSTTGLLEVQRFLYAGLLADINTNYNYYSLNNINKSVRLNLQLSGVGAGQIQGFHILSQLSSPFVTYYNKTTGVGIYPIVCADAQSPTSQWATDFYVFDNNATLGYPAIGRVRNLLLAQGSYTIGKPVKIQGGVVPDAGFNRWLPVGMWGTYTVLMRCYSSVDI